MKQDCTICRVIRTYLLFAVPLLAMIGAFALGDSSGEQLWFADARLIDVLSWGSLAALVGIVTYKAYQEYVIPHRRTRRLEEMQASISDEDLNSP